LKLLNKIKSYIIYVITNFYSLKWKKNNLIKILIQCNNTFSEASWKQVFKEKFDEKFEIVYTKSRYDFVRNFPKSDICFMLGSGNHVKLTKGNKLIYYPLQGLDNINPAIISQYTFIKTSIFNPSSIAEYCLAMLIVAMRDLQIPIKNQIFRIWRQKGLFEVSFKPLSKIRIGILGYGKIGKAVAEIFVKNECQVFCCSRSKHEKDNIQFYQLQDINQFLINIDVLVICLPLNSNTIHLIKKNHLDKLKNGVIINISRAQIISEVDLYESLKMNKNQAAILDVHYKEPLSIFNKFYSLKNVILTPHISGNIGLFKNEIQLDFVEKVIDKINIKHDF
jgi:phosphoglycerate dehydrogenase-like enzyme